MAVTPLSGGGGQGYGPIPSVVVMKNPTTAPYPEEEKIYLLNICPTSSLLTHIFVWDDLLSALWHSPPTCSLCPTPTSLCMSSFIAPVLLAWAIRERPGRRPRGLLFLPSLETREARTLGSGWVQLGSSWEWWDKEFRALGHESCRNTDFLRREKASWAS